MFTRIFRWARGWFPTTWLSIIALPMLAWVYFALAKGRHDRIILSLSMGGLAAIVLMTAQVFLTALWLRIRPQRNRSPLHLETDTPTVTGWSAGLLACNPMVRVEVEWLQPAGTVELLRGETVTCLVRGDFDHIVRRITVSDVLGLARIQFDRAVARRVTSRPGTGRVGRLELMALDAPGDALSNPKGRPIGDLIEMRQYQPGDPIKRVLWKLYQRTGRLMVRVPERAVAATPKTLAYFVAASGDEASAGVTRAMVENGSLGGDVLFGADGTPGATGESREAVERIVRARGDANGLGDFLKVGDKSGIASCVLFVPPTPGRWLTETALQAASFRGAKRAVIGHDGVEEHTRRSRWQRLLLKAPRTNLPSLAGLREVVASLQATGTEVIVVNRCTGEVSFHA